MRFTQRTAAQRASGCASFLHTSDPALSARALRKLWDYREATRSHFGQDESLPWARDKLFQIIHRLEGDSGLARTDAIERFAQDETLDELVASIERDIAASKPHVALDRLHTYGMKKFAHLVVARGEQPAPGETLNARAPGDISIRCDARGRSGRSPRKS